VSSKKAGGAGARGVRYEESADANGEGYEGRLEVDISEEGEAAEEGREGKSCDSLSDPDVFCRLRDGRCGNCGARSTTGEPTRSAEGTGGGACAMDLCGEM
jgi:hypothetical protein